MNKYKIFIGGKEVGIVSGKTYRTATKKASTKWSSELKQQNSIIFSIAKCQLDEEGNIVGEDTKLTYMCTKEKIKNESDEQITALEDDELTIII